jgi:Holliday junction DNA helicase RuvA
MISRIYGKIIEKGTNYLIVDVGGLSYEVFLPLTVMQRIDQNLCGDGKINLITFHYHQLDQAKSIPVLIGFLNQIEKDFFELFITVSGIGPRAALKALNKPISEIAQAIDEADIVYLKSLPGIGEQRAKEIVAKLQNKVGKFGLIKNDRVKEVTAKTEDIAEEVLAVLMQLEYKKAEASVMIRKALIEAPEIETTEDLLNIVYKQRKPR